MSKYGPSKSELKFRFWISIAGLLFLAFAIALRGIPKGPAMFEVIGIAGAFFGGTLLWTLKKILNREYPDND
ncbi:hypothetical protein KX928_16060 [Roseobacter sp. YSTF-M11]|uniref:Uncharacterized protein n=1 Tax=Roseobacter insulae TaxID=2859783 RepID=A0A9X1FXV7_9RHOB|nr:hypothetical protein [Roseobacter insulae]MBW4709307.1 hypothetical protein [Roseobacter insulae]